MEIGLRSGGAGSVGDEACRCRSCAATTEPATATTTAFALATTSLSLGTTVVASACSLAEERRPFLEPIRAIATSAIDHQPCYCNTAVRSAPPDPVSAVSATRAMATGPLSDTSTIRSPMVESALV